MSPTSFFGLLRDQKVFDNVPQFVTHQMRLIYGFNVRQWSSKKKKKLYRGISVTSVREPSLSLR